MRSVWLGPGTESGGQRWGRYFRRAGLDHSTNEGCGMGMSSVIEPPRGMSWCMKVLMRMGG
uniref:Uncharacterized protein n=1 Tax=Arundo donax TaxID=35708 RepID=A0A0A8ZFP2_ARUDO